MTILIINVSTKELNVVIHELSELHAHDMAGGLRDKIKILDCVGILCFQPNVIYNAGVGTDVLALVEFEKEVLASLKQHGKELTSTHIFACVQRPSNQIQGKVSPGKGF